MKPEHLAQLTPFLQADGIAAADAKAGTALLNLLPPLELERTFELVCVQKRPMSEVLDALIEDKTFEEGDRPALTAALRRLMMLTTGLVSEMQSIAPDVHVRQPGDGPGMFTKDAQFDDILRECEQEAAGQTALHDLGVLVAVQKRRFLRLVAENANMPSQFLNANLVQQAADGYLRSLETLVKFQMQMGILKKAPEELEVRVAGAFQQHLAGLGDDMKTQLKDFATAFVDGIKSRYAEDQSQG